MAVATEARAPSHRAPSRRPRTRRTLRIILLLAGAFLAAVAGGLALLVPARSHLADARDMMRAGRDALVDGEPAVAGDRFRSAEAAFARAGETASNPLTDLAGLIPIVGRTPDAVEAVARSGEIVARAGQALSTALEDLPGGVASLAPRDGVLPLDALRSLAAPVGRAAALVAEAGREVAGAETTWVPGPVARPVEGFVAQVEDLGTTLRSTHGLLRALPAFAGGDRPRRYFVGAQNPAELRGTGGLIGAYSILTMRDGRLSLGPFRDAATLEDFDLGDVPPPNPDYARRYDRYGGAGFWKNINMTPDFPSAATAIERLYARTAEVTLDGTILADPAALASLVEATGPVRVPGTDVRLEADEVMPFLANEAYALFEDPAHRKRLLGAMAGEVLRRYLGGASEDDPAEAATALVEAAAGGHLLLHSTDRDIQEAFERAGVAGRLLLPTGDHLVVSANNAAGNKVDFYVDRTIRYEVALLPDGVAEADVRIRYANGAPRSGQPAYVIGPFPGVSRAGEDVIISSAFCGRCRIHRATRDGAETPVLLEEELEHTVATNVLRLRAEDAATLSYGWTILEAWTGDPAAGTYRLTFQGQTTIRPTRLEVVVVSPSGTVVTTASPGMRVDGATASWRGEPGDLAEFEVSFARPLGARILRTAFPLAT